MNYPYTYWAVGVNILAAPEVPNLIKYDTIKMI